MKVSALIEEDYLIIEKIGILNLILLIFKNILGNINTIYWEYDKNFISYYLLKRYFLRR